MESTSTQVPLITPRQVTRDEMNLAEFPLSVLSTRTNPNIKTLEFSDSIWDKSGKPVTRKWVITGADKFGLPTSSDDEVILGLLKLSVNEGFRERKVFFTRYELLKILQWTTEGRSYQRLQNSLDRLSGVRIKATNAFFDNELKAHSTRNFGIVDAYELNDGRDTKPKPSFFIWSEVLFKSFKDGFIKKVDLDFYLSLQSAVTKRLFRYLDKHFWYKSKIQTKLFILAHEKIGVSRNYRFCSSIRQQIDPALDELKERGVISKYEYIGKGSETEVCIYAASGKPRSLPKGIKTFRAEVIDAIPPANYGNDILELLVSKLISRGLREQQARGLLNGKNQETLEKIVRIISYYDDLLSQNSRLISRSPVGFLYKAVKDAETFVLPGEVDKQSHFAFISSNNKSSKEKDNADEEGISADYLIFRAKKIKEVKGSVEKEMLSKITREVEEALVRLRGLITPKRFQETVEHGVDEKLAELFLIPKFDEWLKVK